MANPHTIDMRREKDTRTGIKFIKYFNTINLHRNEDINFSIPGFIYNKKANILLDTGSSITSISKELATKLNLKIKKYKKISLRMGGNSKGATSNLITTVPLKLGNITYYTTFRIMDDQPYEVILGANFIVAANIKYNPRHQTIEIDDSIFTIKSNKNKSNSLQAFISVEREKSNEISKEISVILSGVREMFEGTAGVIDTEYPHRLRLSTRQPVKSRMRRYSPKETAILDQHIEELYKMGYARPSK
ncbi:hypothetical protein BB559_005692, partial [Furculomyces boomerangus]